MKTFCLEKRDLSFTKGKIQGSRETSKTIPRYESPTLFFVNTPLPQITHIFFDHTIPEISEKMPEHPFGFTRV